VSREELAAELRASLARGEMTERFAALALRVARGYIWGRPWAGVDKRVLEDAEGHFGLRLVRYWQRITPLNPFAALTGQARWAVLDVRKRHGRWAQEYAQAVDVARFAAPAVDARDVDGWPGATKGAEAVGSLGYVILIWDGWGCGLVRVKARLLTEGNDMYGNGRNWWPCDHEMAAALEAGDRQLAEDLVVQRHNLPVRARHWQVVFDPPEVEEGEPEPALDEADRI